MRTSNLSPFVFLALLLATACGSGPARDPGDGSGGAGSGGAGGDEPVVDGGQDEDEGGIDPGTSAIGAEAVGGLRSLVATATAVHVQLDLPEEGVEIALFQASSPDEVFAGSPVREGIDQERLVLEGFTAGVQAYLGLGVRRTGDAAYQPTGAVVTVRTGDPIFVDPSANPAVADGTTPDTAFATLTPALVTSFAQGGTSVWVRAGVLDVGSLPLFPGTTLVGGFGAGFDPAARDTSAAETVLRATSTLAVLAIGPGDAPVIVDGISIDGANVASVGVDMDEGELELRDVLVRRCTGRGIRLRNDGTDDPVRVTLIDVRSVNNGGDGLSAIGPFWLEVDASTFADNVQEGFDVDDLVAPNGETVSLVVRGSRFQRNGTQGLDVDLSEPLLLGSAGGRFVVTIEGSLFEQNVEEGLLVDFDFELVDGWEAEVLIEGCRARANGQEGVRIDADAPGPVTVHRLLASANRGDGLGITSETEPGLVIVSASAFLSNAGVGVRSSLGNRSLSVAHCVLAGNELGGVASELAPSTVSSTIAWLQTAAFGTVNAVANVEGVDASTPLLTRLPEAFALATSITGGLATFEPTDFASDALFELDDDGVARTATALVAGSADLDPVPDDQVGPLALAAFAPGESVDEDWRVVAGSAAEGAGLVAPGAPTVDAGIFGATRSGLPGSVDAVRRRLFRLASAEPAPSVGLGQDEAIRLSFVGATLAADSVDTASVRVIDAQENALAVGLGVDAGVLFVSPPAGGWGSGPLRVELSGLRAEGGAPLAATVTLAMPTL